MFKVGLQKKGQGKAAAVCTLSVDSLPEAELLALKFARTMFKGIDIMLVHKGDLEYDVYETFEPIGRVGIKTL